MFPAILIFIIVVVLVTGVRTVHQQTIAVVETFGKYSRTLTPGLNLIIPLVQQVVSVVSLRVQEVKSEIEVKTQDNMFVRLPVALMIKVRPENAADAYYKLSNPENQLSTWVLNTLRGLSATLTLTELFEDRGRLVAGVQHALEDLLAGYGWEVVNVLVDQPSVSPDVQAAFNRVVSSRREREAAEQEAEAKRIRIIGEARAEAEAQTLRAEGLASARRILAQALTEAVVTAKSAGISEQDTLTLLLETNRLDTIKYAAEHGKLVLMDVRSSGAPAPVVPLQ
ncbi:MAG: SPFH domain-containing protein [Pseudomonadota bacterium]|nr:SPFH domain-containing protein [Pseudomonadota bacterium]